jgi:hypothetical protein
VAFVPGSDVQGVAVAAEGSVASPWAATPEPVVAHESVGVPAGVPFASTAASNACGSAPGSPSLEPFGIWSMPNCP